MSDTPKSWDDVNEAAHIQCDGLREARAEILRLKLIIAGDVSRALGTMQGVADRTGDTALHEAADRLSAAINDALRGGSDDQPE